MDVILAAHAACGFLYYALRCVDWRVTAGCPEVAGRADNGPVFFEY
jgi:hypothetical protein